MLFGDYNPGGRLPVTFPKSVGQLPLSFPFKPGADSDGFVRVAHPLYAFGHGLSYTDFRYSDLEITQSARGVNGNVEVSCIVTNPGDVTGDEVVQLYLRDVVSSVTTYVKVLRGFERVTLRPGESARVSFSLTPRDLGLWNKEGHFVVEPGEFKVMVGSSSEDIRLEDSFRVS